MQYNGASSFPGMILWAASTRGPLAFPGSYQVSMKTNNNEQTQSFELIKDPRVSSSQEDLQAQFDFLIKVRDKLTDANDAVKDIRQARAQIKDVIKKSGDVEEISSLGKSILEEMKAIEEALYQTQNESGQDPLNFPIRLNNKVGHLNSLMGIGEFRPTDQAEAFYQEVATKIDEQTSLLAEILTNRIADFNEAVYNNRIEAVKLED